MGKVLQFAERTSECCPRMVVYIELPEAPAVLYGETKDYFAVNLSCSDARLADVPQGFLPQYADDAQELYCSLIPFLRKAQIS